MEDSSRIENILNTAAGFFERGEYYDAAVNFGRALALKEDAMVRNQLALCYYYDDEPEKALEALQPCLVRDHNQPFHHPFAYSLAAIVLKEMGDYREAFIHLRTAIEGYAEGEQMLAEAGLPFDSVGGYLAMLMKAAGELEQHRLLLDIYNKWKKDYLSWECIFYAGTAAFNLKEYQSASEFWSSIGSIIPVCEQMKRVSLMMEDGQIPYFGLEYQILNNRQLQEELETALADDDERERFMSCGYARMLLLGHLLGHEDISEEGAEALLEALIAWSGEWGTELAWCLYENSELSPAVRMVAGQYLNQADAAAVDVLEEGNEPAFSNGNLEVLKVLYTPEMESIYENAWAMIAQGRAEAALELWEDVFYNEKKLYPPAMFDMTDLYMQMNRYEDAALVLDLLEKIDQAEQGVFVQDICFKRAYLAWCQGNPAEAWQQLDRLDVERLTEEEHDRLLEFREQLGSTGFEYLETGPAEPDSPYISALMGERKRRAVEDKSLPVDAGLLLGLKNMPSEWIDAVCLNLGIVGMPRRSQRQEQIREWLNDEKRLARLIGTLDAEQKALLQFISRKHGWAVMDDLETIFGSLDGESYDWTEEGTTTPLGTLWSLGLVMIGRNPDDAQRSRIAVIPQDILASVRKFSAK